MTLFLCKIWSVNFTESAFDDKVLFLTHCMVLLDDKMRLEINF